MRCNSIQITRAQFQIQNELGNKVHEQLCKGVEDCEIISSIPDCVDIDTGESVGATDDFSNRTYYNVAKRDVTAVAARRRNNSRPASRATMRIRVYTRISKKLGLWDKTKPRSENIKVRAIFLTRIQSHFSFLSQVVKAELRTINQNPELRKKLQDLRINIKHLRVDELTVCRNGSVSKKNICGEWDLGISRLERLRQD